MSHFRCLKNAKNLPKSNSSLWDKCLWFLKEFMENKEKGNYRLKLGIFSNFMILDLTIGWKNDGRFKNLSNQRKLEVLFFFLGEHFGKKLLFPFRN